MFTSFKFIRNSSKFSYLCRKPYFNFTDLTKINFNQAVSVIRRFQEDDQFSFTVETPKKRITFTLPEDTTFQDFKSALKKEIEGSFKDIEVYSIDLAEISNISKLSDIANNNYYAIADNKVVFKITNGDMKSAEISENDYKQTLEYFEKLGLPFIEQKILLNYFRRVDHLIEEDIGQKIFTDNNTYQKPFDKNILIENMLEGLVNNKNIHTENEENLINEYSKIKNQLADIEFERSIIEVKVNYYIYKIEHLIIFGRLIKMLN